MQNLVYRARPILSLAGSWALPPTSGEWKNWSSSIGYAKLWLRHETILNKIERSLVPGDLPSLDFGPWKRGML